MKCPNCERLEARIKELEAMVAPSKYTMRTWTGEKMEKEAELERL